MMVVDAILLGPEARQSWANSQDGRTSVRRGIGGKAPQMKPAEREFGLVLPGGENWTRCLS